MVKAGGTNSFDDLGDDGRIILKYMLKEYGGRVWIWRRVETRLVLISGVPCTAGKFGFPKSILLYAVRSLA
jgi:hypothetical protein